MPKVLRILNRFNIGGPTYNAAYLTKHLNEEFETLLIGGEKEPGEDSSEYMLEKIGVKPVLLPELKRDLDFLSDRKAYLKIKEIIREFKPDIVHTHASKAGAVGRLAAASENVPVIVHTFHGHVFHSYFGKLKTSFYKNIERFLAKKSTKIIAISEIQKEELVDQFKICKADKVEVVNLGFDLDRFNLDKELKRAQFRKKYNLKNDELAVGIVGRLAPIKNHTLFVEAAKIVFQKLNNVRFFVIGDGTERNYIENQVESLGLKNNFVFTSWIKEMDVAYAGLDLVALSSDNEGTPVSLIEAQAASKAIVTTDVGGVKDVVIDNQTALISTPGDVETFAGNLIELLSNTQKRKEFELRGWSHVKDKFHYTRLAKDIENLYVKLLNK